jgi:hypothetical protein
MSFYNSKRRSLISLGRSGSGIAEEFNGGAGGSCGSTSSSGSSNGPPVIMGSSIVENVNAGPGGGRNKSQPTYSLQQLARSRSFGGVYQSPGGGSYSGRNKGSFYNNFLGTR